ncbi:Zinc dependent phospholipase C [Massilia sp. PDC64]|nr:zinc dependent phospholipase C family protein [Massilia sp. PDC64]SDD41771.1 Zinc dependent phospholipase C [Massilia sp. PDC64]
MNPDYRPGAVLLALAACCLPAPASAWGLKTHLWVAEKVLDDVRHGCEIDLGLADRKRYALERDVCTALTAHPAEFRAGVLGPDVFPDFVVGQVTVHPGTNADLDPNAPDKPWGTGQYMSHLLTNARTPAELAFAYGYLVHGAGDVFAHTYVNNYAGDIFDVTDAERRVESRHFVLEKYIEARTPLPSSVSLDATTVRVPTAFVTENLIFDPKIRNQYGGNLAAFHVRMMYDLHDTDRRRDDRPLLAKTQAVLQAAADRLTAARRRLATERAALQRAAKEQPLASRLIGPARTLLGKLSPPEAVDLLQSLPSEARLQVQAAVPAPAADPLAGAADTLRAVADAPDTAEADERSVQALDAVLAMLDGGDAVSAADQRVAEAARAKLAETDALVRVADTMRRTGALPGATAALSAARAELASARRIDAANLRLRVDALSSEVSRLEKLQGQAAETHGFQRFRQALRANRIDGIELATRAFVDASMATSLDVLNDRPKPMKTYDDWRRCWALVYVDIPYQWTRASCKIQANVDDVRAAIASDVEALIAGLPEPLPTLATKYARVKIELIRQAKAAAWKTADKTVADLTGGDMTVRFVQMVSGGAPLDAAALKDAYQRESNRDGKSLLLLPDIDQLVDDDLATRDGTPHPEEFQALRHSVTLAKLSILSLDAVNQLVRDQVGADRSALFPDGDPLYPHGGAKSSILPLMVKSIDGNHQWQAYGIPYPRTRYTERDLDPAPHRYGYNAYRERGYGMRLFADQKVRERLFAQLFPTAFIGAINRYLQDTTLYPFVTCAAVPFPVTTLPDGSPAPRDVRCLEAPRR